MQMDDKLAGDLLRAGASVLGAGAKPAPYRSAPEPMVSQKFHKDAWAPGEVLNDYTDRTPSEDGLFVKVVTHRERIELIEQPPTAEEILEEKEQRKHSIIIGSIVAAGLVGVAGILQVLDRKQVRKVEVKADAR